jgi:hypothetical protein
LDFPELESFSNDVEPMSIASLLKRTGSATPSNSDRPRGFKLLHL